MTNKNKLMVSPPYAVENVLKHFGTHLRIARLRRNITIQQMAEKIGTGPRAVMGAEQGKISTGVGIYVAILWAMDLLEPLQDLASPERDTEGQNLALLKEGRRARKRRAHDNDF